MRRLLSRIDMCVRRILYTAAWIVLAAFRLCQLEVGEIDSPNFIRFVYCGSGEIGCWVFESHGLFSTDWVTNWPMIDLIRIV